MNMQQNRKNMSKDKPWGGRFSEATDAFVEAFTASIEFDKRLYKHDIQGSVAHASMLAKVGLLTQDEADMIHVGLAEILVDIEAGNFQWSVSLEDIHMNIEARLTDKIGITGKKLHTGRSRNDQVATDIRLWLRDEIALIQAEIHRLQAGLVQLAAQEVDTILPGFTHLQVATDYLWTSHDGMV
jgi:argininosuccinate lyase